MIRLPTIFRRIRAVGTGAALCVALAATGAPAAAHVRGGGDSGINIDLNRTSGVGAGVPSSGYGAAAAQPGTWNNFVVGGPASINLSGLTGAPSGVTLTRVTGAGIQSTCPAGASVDFSRLMCDYDFAVAGVVNHVEYRLDGLQSGSYTVYTYGGRAEFVAPFQIQLWRDSTFVGQDNISGTMTNAFALGVTHTVRNVVLAPGEALRIVASDNSGEFGDPVSISGIQIVRTGEPTAVILSPAPFSCVCPPVTITGTASASSGFAGWVLEYSTNGSDPWTVIASGASQVNNGTLAVWNPALPENYYILRLTVQTTSGLNSTAVSVIYLNQQIDSVSLNAPSDGQVLGGTVCFDGTVWDQCGSTFTLSYRALPAGVFALVAPAAPGQIINLPLGSGWSTDSGPTAVADGNYQVRLQGTNTCGDPAETTRNIVVDNTAPTAVITSPVNCTSVSGIVPIIGTASDANLAGWTVQYVGGNTNQWVTIASGSGNIVNGVLAQWDTTRLPPCCYAVRLIATDEAMVDCTPFTHQSEFVVLVEIGSRCLADFNGDNVVNSQDFFAFLTAFFAGC